MSFLAKLARDRSANVTVIFALSAFMLIGAAGAATDTIQWTLLKRKLQRQADSAAMAGAMAKLSSSDAAVAANREINRYTSINLLGTPVIETPPTSGTYSGNSRAVRVTVESDATLPFSSIFLKRQVTMAASSTAAYFGAGDYCVVALEDGDTTGITFQGNTTVNLGCGIATNAQGSSAVTAGGSSYVVASPVAAVGNVPASSNYANGTVLESYSLAVKDPFAALPDPSVPGGCNSALSTKPNGTDNIKNPTGVICYRGIDVKGKANFDAGVYIIDGGDLTLSAKADVSGTGVTFILTSSNVESNPGSVGTVTINGGAEMDLTAPGSGTYAGILIYQDRRAADGTNKINGNSGSRLQGSIYMASQLIRYNGTSGMDTNCLHLVARELIFTGNNSISNTCPSNSGVDPISGYRVHLVE